MKLFDMRHKWGPVVWHEMTARYSRTCLACGRTDTAEALIPDSMLDILVEQFMKPNLYRAISRATFG